MKKVLLVLLLFLSAGLFLTTVFLPTYAQDSCLDGPEYLCCYSTSGEFLACCDPGYPVLKMPYGGTEEDGMCYETSRDCLDDKTVSGMCYPCGPCKE
jgi:hypothetical protein